MPDITIKTNNHFRELLTAYELPKGILESEFDYLVPCEDNDALWSSRFFQYLGEWYDVGEFVSVSTGDGEAEFGHRVSEDSSLAGWQGILTDSYFSGIVIRYPDDEEVWRLGCSSDRYDYICVGRYFT